MIHRWTLQQLRLFEAVARHRSYTRAAQEQYLTQPAVSIQIKRLEGSLGLPLFEQVGKTLFLTRAGKEVYAAASEVVTRLEALAGAVTDLKGTIAGPLQIAVVNSAKFFMPHVLGRFLREHLEVHPQLTVINQAGMLERLAANQDDFVVMGQIPEHLAPNARPFMENLLVPIAHLAKAKAELTADGKGIAPSPNVSNYPLPQNRDVTRLSRWSDSCGG